MTRFICVFYKFQQNFKLSMDKRTKKILNTYEFITKFNIEEKAL